MPTERVVFASSMEGLWRALQPPTPLEAQAFARAGVTGRHYKAAYPLEQYTDVLEACGASRFGQQAPLERFAEVGRMFVKGYQTTLIGKALLTLMPILGPRRTLERMTRNFRTANNYTDVMVESVSPNHHRVHITGVRRPGLFIGVLELACQSAGAKELSVKVIDYQGELAIYEVRWAA